MATTYTQAKVFWGSEGGQMAEIYPAIGSDFKNVIVTYPAAATPYFSVTLTRPNDTTVVIESQNLTIVRPG